jgi:hypothetical protein
VHEVSKKPSHFHEQVVTRAQYYNIRATQSLDDRPCERTEHPQRRESKHTIMALAHGLTSAISELLELLRIVDEPASFRKAIHPLSSEYFYPKGENNAATQRRVGRLLISRSVTLGPRRLNLLFTIVVLATWNAPWVIATTLLEQYFRLDHS